MKKKVIVKQRDLKDCGAACLASVINYYDGYVPLEDIRKDTYTNLNGTTFYHLLDAARKYGFEGSGLSVSLDRLILEENNLPIIAQVTLENKMNHFIVIYKITKKTITIMDPYYGIRKLDYAYFKEIFTGNILLLNPIIKIIKLKSKKSIFNLFIDILKAEKIIIQFLSITCICLTVISIITSFYFKIAVDEISSGQGIEIFWLLFITFFSFTIIKIILNFIREQYLTYLNKNIDIKMIFPFIKHIFLLPLNIIKSRSTGEITTRINDLNNIKNIFSKIFVTLFLDLPLAFLSIFVLYKINSELFFLLCLIIIIYFIVGFFSSPIIYKRIKSNIDKETEFNAALIENVDGILAIKNINETDFVMKKIESSFISYLKDTFRFSKNINLINLLKSSINEIGLFLINSYGLYLIINNNLDFLTLVTFNTVIVYVFEPIKNVIDLLPSINHLKVTIEKVSEFSNLEIEKLETKHEKFSNGDIEIRNLGYSYNNYHYLFKNINFKINKGENIFLKGASGTGKSTVCKLLYRLFDMNTGDILINNINVKDYSINTIRENITYLAQKENLFTETIRENITFGRDISLEKLETILKITRVDEILNKKALRLETLMLDGGFNFSGGERQRIAMARALTKNADIIILDEALSEVEETMEQNIIKDLLDFCQNKTLIYVSHRNNAKLFDRCINLEELNGIK